MSAEENNQDWQRSSNLNEREIDEARVYLRNLADFQGVPIYCGLNADDGTGCKKVVKILEQEWIAERKRKNRSIERKQPFLVINEKRGNGLHTINRITKKISYCGNINYYCYSCNKIYKKRTVKIIDPDEPYSNKKTVVRTIFKNDLLDFLRKNKEICKNACINKWSNKYDCAQSLLEKSLAQIDEIDILIVYSNDWGFDCHYPRCDGEHIITFEKKFQPIPKTSDEEFIDKENQVVRKK